MQPNGKRIIVVDDEASMRGLLHDFLRSQGYEVECFATGNAALKRVGEGTPPITAVVADIRMAPMNGMELLKKLKEGHSEIPVVLFTSAGGPDQRDEALRGGALSYFTKPFPLSELQRVLTAASPKSKLKK